MFGKSIKEKATREGRRRSESRPMAMVSYRTMVVAVVLASMTPLVIQWLADTNYVVWAPRLRVLVLAMALVAFLAWLIAADVKRPGGVMKVFAAFAVAAAAIYLELTGLIAAYPTYIATITVMSAFVAIMVVYRSRLAVVTAPAGGDVEIVVMDDATTEEQQEDPADEPEEMRPAAAPAGTRPVGPAGSFSSIPGLASMADDQEERAAASRRYQPA